MLVQEPFDYWNIIKKRLHFEAKEPFFTEGEIWWCSLGMNIGHEYNGKNENFERPVLIVTKINTNTAWIVPVTSKVKKNAYRFELKDFGGQVILAQIRTISSQRLLRKITVLTPEILIKILELLEGILRTAKLRQVMAENLGDPNGSAVGTV